jgi:hypothetical protein
MKIQSKQIVMAAIVAVSLPAAYAAEQSVGSTKSPGARTSMPEGRTETQTQTERPTRQNGKGQMQYSGRITSVNRKDKTITVEDRQSGRETLHIGQDTRIMKGSDSASWDQLREGEQVRGTASRTGELNHAQTIEIGR